MVLKMKILIPLEISRQLSAILSVTLKQRINKFRLLGSHFYLFKLYLNDMVTTVT